jgi:hypothetical protein
LRLLQYLFSRVYFYSGGIGLTVYWLIFAATLNTYPRTIFFVALGNAVAAFVILRFVRVVPEVQVDDGENIA